MFLKVIRGFTTEKPNLNPSFRLTKIENLQALVMNELLNIDYSASHFMSHLLRYNHFMYVLQNETNYLVIQGVSAKNIP